MPLCGPADPVRRYCCIDCGEKDLGVVPVVALEAAEPVVGHLGGVAGPVGVDLPAEEDFIFEGICDG